MYNYKLVVAYDGSRYHGWQKQNVRGRKTQNKGDSCRIPHSAQELVTVQGVLETAISRVIKQNIKLIGASRTDAGVNALYQVCNFLSRKKIAINSFKKIINFNLPRDIVVKKIQTVPLGFHSRFSARGKEYEYRISNSREKPVFDKYCIWIRKKLNIQKMNSASKLFLGEQDFKFVAKSDGVIKNTRCNVKSIRVLKKGGIVSILIKSDRFLWNMARNIACVLVKIGTGRFTIEDLKSSVKGLKTAKSLMLKKPLDPKGLFLKRIFYTNKF